MTDLTSAPSRDAGPESPRPDVTPLSGPTAPGGPALDAVAATVVVLSIVVGALERLWLLVHTPLFADTAVVGLMGRQIEHGHVLTFYWNQPYGGVEPYLVAALNDVIPGPFGVNLTSALLSGLAAVVVGLIVHELCGDRRVGWLAGAMAWVWPYAAVWNSTRELGFHFVSLLLGLVMIWLAIRVEHGHRGDPSLLALGVAAGLGIWASPEVAYFAVPAAIVLIGSFRRWATARRLAWVVAGVVLGALPWLYTNAHSGFASLSTGIAQSQGLGHRLGLFFHEYLPIEFSLRYLFAGGWIGGTAFGEIVYLLCLAIVVAALVGAAWLFFRTRRDLGLVACGAGLVVFPLILSLNSKVEYWVDGRYSVDTSFLVVIVVFATASGLARELPDRRAGHAAAFPRRRSSWVIGTLTVAVCLGMVSTLAQSGVSAQFASSTATLRSGTDALFSGWHNPDLNLEHSIAAMRAAHITAAYADYWTAYNIDYLDPGIAVSPSRLDVVRSDSILGSVDRARRPAWLFSAPAHLDEADMTFGDQQGPGSYTEDSFVAMLRGRGISSRVVHLGILDAVIPDAKFTVP